MGFPILYTAIDALFGKLGLSPQEAEALITELFEAEQPYACPHGRPIVLKMSDVDLERRFGRR